jgi:predicted Fe-Mo cluster-binding NifX family protein
LVIFDKIVRFEIGAEVIIAAKTGGLIFSSVTVLQCQMRSRRTFEPSRKLFGANIAWIKDNLILAQGSAMKIAVTSDNRNTVTDHAGRCAGFWIYQTEYADVVEKQWIKLPAGESFHATNLPQLLRDINVLISGGMASDLRYRLKQQAIQAVTTLETDPDRAVNAWLNGTLEEMPPHSRLNCSSHAQGLRLA